MTPSNHDIREMCLELAHAAEEPIAETMVRARMYLEFMTGPLSADISLDNIVPLNSAIPKVR